jgi:hypothetical protein
VVAVCVGVPSVKCCAVNVPVGVSVSPAACHATWLRVRNGRRRAFEARWLNRLLALQAALSAGRWQPGRTVFFVVTHPKTRAIHAPGFADRVMGSFDRG